MHVTQINCHYYDGRISPKHVYFPPRNQPDLEDNTYVVVYLHINAGHPLVHVVSCDLLQRVSLHTVPQANIDPVRNTKISTVLFNHSLPFCEHIRRGILLIHTYIHKCIHTTYISYTQHTYMHTHREDGQQLPAAADAVVFIIGAASVQKERNGAVEHHIVVVSQVVDLLERPVLEGKLQFWNTRRGRKPKTGEGAKMTPVGRKDRDSLPQRAQLFIEAVDNIAGFAVSRSVIGGGGAVDTDSRGDASEHETEEETKHHTSTAVNTVRWCECRRWMTPGLFSCCPKVDNDTKIHVLVLPPPLPKAREELRPTAERLEPHIQHTALAFVAAVSEQAKSIIRKNAPTYTYTRRGLSWDNRIERQSRALSLTFLALKASRPPCTASPAKPIDSSCAKTPSPPTMEPVSSSERYPSFDLQGEEGPQRDTDRLSALAAKVCREGARLKLATAVTIWSPRL